MSEIWKIVQYPDEEYIYSFPLCKLMGLLSDDVLPVPNEQRNEKQLLKWEDLFNFTLKSDDLDENNC